MNWGWADATSSFRSSEMKPFNILPLGEKMMMPKVSHVSKVRHNQRDISASYEKIAW